MDLNLSNNLGNNFKAKSLRNPMIEVVLLIIFISLFTWFIILPKKTEIQTKQEELDVLKIEGSKVSGELAQLQVLVRTLESSKKEIGLLDESLPLDGRVTRLHFLIESLAKSVGVTLGNLNVTSNSQTPVSGNKELIANPFKTDRKLQKLSGSVSAIGELSQLKAFLEKLEDSGRLIDVSDVVIDGGPNGQLNLRLTISSYYFAP